MTEQHNRAGARRTGILQVEAGDPPAIRHGVDLSAADAWHVLLTLDGIPVKSFRLAGPGRCESTALLDAAVVAQADQLRATKRAIDGLAARMGEREREYPSLTCTVAICTHRRRDELERALAAVQRLDPAPDAVLVVDNAPGDEDCRHIAARAGARYLRVDEQGLNRARTAAVGACDTELIAFTDDDCEPPPRWLARLPELFSDRMVAAVTGPAFAADLGSPSARSFESAASFSRGLTEQRFDWLTLHPIHATRVGAGANMTFRRTVLEQLAPAFPPELDAGTPTESGGDTYALYRVLADGLRVAYDPGTFTFHHHRGNSASLHRAIRGYGTGLTAVATKLFAEERELGGPRIARWLLSNYLETMGRGLTGRARPHDVRIAWDYLRGGLRGPRVWVASRPLPHARRRARTEPAVAPQPFTEVPAADDPLISVVVPTAGRTDSLARCVAALRDQVDAPPFEVLVMDGTGGAGAARNTGTEQARGEILLFLDDDLIAESGLLRRHAEAHTDRDTVMAVGYSPPRPVERTLAAMSASLWWEDHFRRLEHALAHTFVDVLSGNMSVRRETFEAVGRFDPAFERREDWEWGLRALEAGVEMRYLPDAVARHEFRLDARRRLAAARLEGKGDALLIDRCPDTLPSLPLTRNPPLGGSRYRMAVLALGGERSRRIAMLALDALERAGMSTTWAGWFNIVQRAAYQHGLRDGGLPAGLARHRVPVKQIELSRPDPVAPPRSVAPLVELAVNGRAVARVAPRDGQWNAGVARDLVAAADPAVFPRVRRERAEPRNVRVLDPPGRGRRRWEAIDAGIRSSREPLVAVTLLGAPAPDMSTVAATALSGDRVGLALGTIGEPKRGLSLIDREVGGGSFPVFGRPAGWMAVRRDTYVRLGGLDPALASLGGAAPLLELVARVLRADLVVGVSGEGDWGPRRLRRVLAEWMRWQAHGALMTVYSRSELFSRGYLPLLARTWRAGFRRSGDLRPAAATTLAFTVGSLLGLVRGRHPAPGSESSQWWSSSESIPAPPTPDTEWSSPAATRSRR